ncbi:hypothetical protein FQR65_LT08562 [Abscondita terminalis]|nr:hypothetical protein FQR65_LT08562 [Abscondita terminalis]
MSQPTTPQRSRKVSSILTPYICSTPLSTQNEQASLSILNLSEIQDVQDFPRSKRKRNGKQTFTFKNTTNNNFTGDHDLSLFFNRLSMANWGQTNEFNIEISENHGVWKKHKRIWKGKDWTLFKPKRMEGIYNSLLTNQDYKKEVHRWMKFLKENRAGAIIDMIQFIVDTCGFQEFDVGNVVKPDDLNLLEIINYMEENPPKLQIETGKYLFKANTEWAIHIQNMICKFIEYLFEVLNEDSTEFTHVIVVFSFIICSTASKNRSVRHTTVVLVAKLHSVLLNIQANGTLNTPKDFVKHFLQKFVKIIEDNCNLEDSQLESMKIVCVREMYLWFCFDTNLINNSKYFNRLMRLIQNQSKKVRKAALKTCYYLITTENLIKDLKPLMHTFAKVIAGRICDVDYDIAIYAVKLCTILLENFEDVLEDIVCNKIISLMFGKHSLLAMAAGEFFRKFLTLKNEGCFFTSLVCYVHSSQTGEMITFLVESLVDCCPELSDWSTMIDYILTKKVATISDLKRISMCILSESVQQRSTGQCKIPRMKTYKRRSRVSSVEITNAFSKKMPELLKSFKKDPVGLKMLLEILLIIDLEEVALSEDIYEIDTIISTIRPIFVEQTDQDVLELISKFFSTMCGNNVALKNKYQCKIDTLKFATRDAVSNFLKQHNKAEIEDWMLRTQLLGKYHDLSEIMSFTFFMESIEFMEKHDFTPKTIQYTLKSGYQLLKWRLNYVIDSAIGSIILENLNEIIALTKTQFEKYTQYCFKIMTDSHVPSLRLVAFECICKVYLKFKYDLERPSAMHRNLSSLIPVIENPTYVRHFMNYTQEALFGKSKRDTLCLRRFLLAKVFNLIHLNVIESKELPKLYQHYFSHTEDYEDIFESALKHYRDYDTTLLTVVILFTLTYKYTQYLLSNAKNRGSVGLDNDLLNLAKRFQLLINRSVPDSKFFLTKAIDYATTSKAHYMFLNVVKVFSKPLSTNDKQALINSLKAKIPGPNIEDDCIKKFVWYLKNNATAQKRVVRVDLNSSLSLVSGSSSTNENYNISDGSIIDS